MYNYESDLKISSFSLLDFIDSDMNFYYTKEEDIPERLKIVIEKITTDNNGFILKIKFKNKLKALERLLTVIKNVETD